MAELRRALGLLDATMVNVGVIVGSAVFLTAGEVARALPHPLLQLAAWAVAAFFSLAGALTIAELGAAMPRAGGLCVYLRAAFGPFWGFLYGWALFVVIQTAAIAAVAVAFARYCGHFVPLSARGVELLAVAAVAALTGVNVLGVREGVVTQNLVTFAKLAVILGLIALAFGAGAGSWSHFSAPPGVRAVAGLGTVGAALIGPLAAFDGWITTSYIGGEVKDPARNLPLAALLCIAIVTVLYLALNGAYLYVLGSQGVAGSQLVAVDTARALLGERGADVAAAMVVVATLGGINGNILGGARVFYAMAELGLFWRSVARVHPRFGTPAVALLAQGAVSAAFVFTGGFEQLLTSFLFASWLFYALGGLAVFVLRQRTDLQRPYRVWGYPVVPALFVAFAAVLLAGTVAADPRDAALGAALLLTGVPAYLFFSCNRSGEAISEKDSSRSPAVDNRTWVVLADEASAKLYESKAAERDWKLVAEMSHPESRAKESELVSDKPGRVQQSRGYKSAMEPPTPRKKVEIDRFARELAQRLDDAAAKGAYERLILVAAPSFLGVLRKHLADRVQRRVAATVEKDYLHLDLREVRERLGEQIEAR